jgi:hypothetical protein
MRATDLRNIWLVIPISLFFSLLASCSSSVPGWTNVHDSSIDPQKDLVGSWTESRGYDATFYKNGQYVGGSLSSGRKGSKIEKGTWEIANGNRLTVTYQHKNYTSSNQVEIFFQTGNQFTTFIKKGPLSAQNLFTRKGFDSSTKPKKSGSASLSDKKATGDVAGRSDEDFKAPLKEDLKQVGTREERTSRRIFVAYPLLIFMTGSTQAGGNETSFESDGMISSGISAGIQLAPNSIWGLGVTHIVIDLKGGDATLETTMVDLIRGYDEEGWGDEIGYGYIGAGFPSISCNGCFSEKSSGLGYQLGFVFAPSNPGLAVKIGYYGGMISYSEVDARSTWHSITAAIGYEF